MRLEFELVRGERGKWGVFDSRTDTVDTPVLVSSRTKAETRFLRELHKLLKGNTHFKLFAEWREDDKTTE